MGTQSLTSACLAINLERMTCRRARARERAIAVTARLLAAAVQRSTLVDVCDCCRFSQLKLRHHDHQSSLTFARLAIDLESVARGCARARERAVVVGACLLAAAVQRSALVDVCDGQS